MIGVKGNNKRGASVAFITQLIEDTVTKEVSNTVSSTNLSSTNLSIQNSNFGSTTARNLTHPVLVTNSYGTGISVTPDQYSSSALTLQCKANDTYSIGAFAFADDVSEAPFDVLSDGRIECTKALLLSSKVGETTSNIYMYGTNKAVGLPLAVQPDSTLTCSGGTASGTNTGTLGVLANTFSVSNNATIGGTLTVTGNSSLVGNLTLPTPAASFVNNATSLDINFSIASPVAGTTYQEFMTIANSGTSGLSGGAWSGGIVSNTNSFTTWSTLASGVRKEAVRILTVNGVNTYVGINNTNPTSTLDVINTGSGVNVINLRNTAGVSMCSVSNAGLLTLAPSGTSTVMVIGGTSYSAATVQAAFALPSAPVFTGNITLPTTVTAPLVGQLGYTTTVYGTAQSGANPLQILNLAQTSLGVGVWHIIGTMQYNTPDSGIAFTQVVTAISTTSTNYDSQTAGFVRTYNSGSGGDFSTYVYSQQVHRILTLTAATTVYVTGTVSATFMTTWGTPSNGSSLQAVRIA